MHAGGVLHEFPVPVVGVDAAYVTTDDVDSVELTEDRDEDRAELPLDSRGMVDV